MGRRVITFCQYLPGIILLCLVLFINHSYSAQEEKGFKHNLFPVLRGLEGKVSFWEKIFTKYSSYQAVIHDSNNPEIIYEVINFDPNNLKGTTRTHKVNAAKRKYSQILENIHSKKSNPSQLNANEQLIYKKFHHINGSKKFLWASQNVRCQWGIKDKFEQGLVRSGRYQSWMKKIFSEEDLPQELTFLPHVESSFNYLAYSKAGAAGIWQFIPSTGKLFLRIDPYLDERLDPLISSRAAARLLKKNYHYLGNWPLAITAYNHGLPGLLRAVKKTGSHDLTTIIAQYQSPIFGFASKNFYAEFLAALKVAKDHQKYFVNLTIERPLQYHTITLPDYIDMADLQRHFSLTDEEIRIYNPSLLSPILKSQLYIPKGFQLRVPINKGPNLSQRYAQIPREKKYNYPKRLNKYEIRKGDTLIAIAKKFNVSVKDLQEINGMGALSLIRVGQSIRLPQPHAVVAAALPPKDEASSLRQREKPAINKRRNKKDYYLKAKIEPIKPISIKKILDKKGDTIDWVTVEPQETLERFSEWCGVTVQKLRQLNRLQPGQLIKVGQRLKVEFSGVDMGEFKNRRSRYHKGMQEEFFSKYRVEKTITHTLKKRENVWYLCQNVYQIPYWLVKKYNPGRDLTRLDKDDELVMPIIKKMD